MIVVIVLLLLVLWYLAYALVKRQTEKDAGWGDGRQERRMYYITERKNRAGKNGYEVRKMKRRREKRIQKQQVLRGK